MQPSWISPPNPKLQKYSTCIWLFVREIYGVHVYMYTYTTTM